MKPRSFFLIVFAACIAGCSDSIELANYDMSDSSIEGIMIDGTESDSAGLLSAFYGLDSEAPFTASLFVCRGATGKDASPVIFPHEVNLETLQAGDFKIVRSDGSVGTVLCVTPAPAYDAGELRTLLLIGDYGSSDNQPATVEINGNLLSIDNRVNFKGKAVEFTPLEDGPSMVLAQVVPDTQWELGKKATFFPFGGGNGCPQGTKQIVRVVWSGGVTKPGGKEVDDVERLSYSVSLRDTNGDISTVAPFALGDLGDGDNNHKLCLDVDGAPVSVAFPKGLMTDPREDLNPKTFIEVSTSQGN